MGIIDMIEFNCYNKAHICIITSTPTMTAEKTFQDIQLKEDLSLGTLNIKVEPGDMGAFMQDLSDEIWARRAFLQKYAITRVDEFPTEEEQKPDIIKKVYVTMLFPRTISHHNIQTIVNMLCKTTPLDIHFILILAEDTHIKLMKNITDNVYWVYNEDNKELVHK